MLAKPTDHLPQARELRGGSLFEPKWDGYRGLVGVDAEGRPQIRSRRGTDLTRAFPDIAGPAADQLPPGTLLDGELVVWTGAELDFGQLQQRLISPARAATLARTRPASYMIFDVLQLRGEVLTGEPLRARRRRLEGLLPGLVPPLQITPATRDRDLAERWLSDYAAAGVGIEGLVIKGLAESYHPGRRRWLKLRNRTSLEAIVGAITGTLTAPDRLILALPAADGSLVVAGGTGPLTKAQQRDVSAFLQLPVTEHPWPPEIPSGHLAGWGSKDRLPVTRVEPSLVVEIEADAAYEGHFRHITRLLRTRPDLTPAEVAPL